jgi:hypothetical protein
MLNGAIVELYVPKTQTAHVGFADGRYSQLLNLG